MEIGQNIKINFRMLIEGDNGPIIKTVWIQGTIVDKENKSYNIMYLDPYTGEMCKKLFHEQKIYKL